jgi:hypothetical protein
MLKKKLACGTLPHAMLVSGGTASSRLDFAHEAAVAILSGDDPEAAKRAMENGNMADLVTIEPEGGQIKVYAVQGLIERLRLKPFSADRTLAVIVDGDLMNAQAQNKLLKTLEEPPGDSVIMILAANTEMLRATIRSRCLKISLAAETVRIPENVESDAIRALSAALFGKPAHEAFSVLDDYTDDPFPLLDAMELFLRDIVIGQRSRELVGSEAHLEIALKMKAGQGATRQSALEDGIGIIEDTRAALLRGRVNRKSSLRDMALRLRTGGEER